MDTVSFLEQDNAQTYVGAVKKSIRISFSAFRKAIIANSELRKQIDDIVDLGLLEFAFRKNTAFIQSVREKAEAETFELMMQFVNGSGDYQFLRSIIHRNRVIRTLAIKDRKDQADLIKKVTHLKTEED